MKLINIEKAIYRQRLNRVIIGFIVVFAGLSLGFSAILIGLFSEQGINLAAATDTSSSNFKYNFLGVVLALLACAAILHSLKTQSYFAQIYYVWQLKQLHNQIYRKLKRIKAVAFDDNNINAIIVLHYYYSSLKQVYLLDDNTLTMGKLSKDHEKLLTLISNKELEITTEQFDNTMLKAF